MICRQCHGEAQQALNYTKPCENSINPAVRRLSNEELSPSLWCDTSLISSLLLSAGREQIYQVAFQPRLQQMG